MQNKDYYSKRSYKTIIKSEIKLLKLNKFQGLWLPMLVFFLMGAIWVLSIYFLLLGVIGFYLISLLSKNTMDNLAAAYLDESVNYNFKNTNRVFQQGVYHIFGSAFKSFIAYFITSAAVAFVTFIVLSSSGSSLLTDFREFFSSKVITPGIEPLIIMFIMVPQLVFLLCFFYFIRQNELGIYFAGTFMNKNPDRFIFTPMNTRFYRMNFFKSIRRDYYKETWIGSLISSLLFVGGSTGFLFIFLSAGLDVFLSAALGIAFGIFFYGLGYVFERLHDALYFVQRREKVLLNFDNNQLGMIATIQSEMDSHFVDNRFHAKKTVFHPDGVPTSEEMSPEELEFAGDQLFVRYKHGRKDAEIIDAEIVDERSDEDIIFGADIVDWEDKK